MRIGIDARELFGRPTGVGRYLANILAAWAEMPEATAHRFVLYDPAEPEMGLPASTPAPIGAVRRPVAGGNGSWWEQVRLPVALRRDRLDVLFAPAYTAPAGRTGCADHSRSLLPRPSGVVHVARPNAAPVAHHPGGQGGGCVLTISSSRKPKSCAS
jgi:hypothetical protein